MGARQNETSLSGFPASEVVQTRRQMEVDGFDRALDRLQLLLFAVRPHTSHDGAHDLMCDGHQPCPSTRKVCFGETCPRARRLRSGARVLDVLVLWTCCVDHVRL